MGQRHQLFVIARVGKQYRSLAAVHHQWLYGLKALDSASRLLRIFSDPANRLPIEQELHIAADYFEDKGPPPSWPAPYEEYDNTPCHFPFIATCLVVGAGYDFDRHSAEVVHVLSFDLGFDQGDNNDGITVIDITDLDDVRYCFVNLEGRFLASLLY